MAADRLGVALRRGPGRAHVVAASAAVGAGTGGQDDDVAAEGAVCGDSPSIDFTVDGTLGSEVDQPPLDIAGEVRLG